MNWRDHIHSDPAVLGGKPVVRGTRISVELILEYLEDGASPADVGAAYPQVSEKAVRAAIAFARDLLHEEASAASRRAA